MPSITTNPDASLLEFFNFRMNGKKLLYESSALKLSRLYRRVRNIRKDFLHKETTNLAKTKSVIVVEDLGIKEMLSNKRLSRQISDVAWSEFRRMLEYKMKWYGSTLIVAPRFFPSSKTCSACGILINELPLERREWQCAEYYKIHDRDENAAKNLLKWSTRGSPGIHACGDTSNGARKKNLQLCVDEARSNEWNICP